jgi:hypothetical protein
MAIAVAFSPKRLDCGTVPPDSEGPDITLDPSFPADAISFTGGTETTAPAGANVTASIEGDTSHFEIRDVSILHFVMRDVDPTTTFHIARGETRFVHLTLQASPDAPLGENIIFVRQFGSFRG